MKQLAKKLLDTRIIFWLLLAMIIAYHLMYLATYLLAQNNPFAKAGGTLIILFVAAMIVACIFHQSKNQKHK